MAAVHGVCGVWLISKKMSLISQNRILNDKSIYEISAITTTTNNKQPDSHMHRYKEIVSRQDGDIVDMTPPR